MPKSPKARQKPTGGAGLSAILQRFFEHQLLLKLYHFQTKHYGAHKASDAYLAKFVANLDRFFEVAQGLYGTVQAKQLPLRLNALTDATVDAHLQQFARYLGALDVAKSNADLAAIRDEMLADVNQLRYLLLFK